MFDSSPDCFTTLRRAVSPLLFCIALVSSHFAFAESPVELTLLTEESIKGNLQTLDSDSITVSSDGGDRVVPLRDLLQVDFLHPEEIINNPDASFVRVELTDGSRLRANELTISGTEFSLKSDLLGAIAGRSADVKSAAFVELVPTNREQWTRFVERESNKDLLVIPRGEGLDFIEGIVAGFDQRAIQFLLDGEEITVAREKVVGVVFNRESRHATPVGKLLLDGDDQLSFSSLSVANGQFSGTFTSGSKFAGELSQLRSIDLRLGRLVYLSELDPRLEEYTTFFDEPKSFIKMRRDRNFNNGPIRLGNRVYRRGVCLHSRTLLRYRVAEGFRRFQATMGIEDLVGSGTNTEAHVLVSIKADDRILFEGEVKGGDPPQVLDYDISNARDLEFLVDFGKNLSIQDHLALANARLVK